uniref:Uncharacterized protein n=1 Tax=Schistocephalus solidus TaxID=70667 RepID=A0A0X3P017_SCHSO
MYPYNHVEPYYSAPQVPSWHYGWPTYASAAPAGAPEPLSSTYLRFESPRISQSAAEFCKKDAVCQTDIESEFYGKPVHRFVPPSEYDRSICTVSPVKIPRNRCVSRSGAPMPNYGQLRPPFAADSQNISSFSHQNGEFPTNSPPLSTSSLSPTHLPDQAVRCAKVITKWALINMKESGECCLASFANGHQKLMYSNVISSVHRSGRIVDDGNGLYKLSGGLYWRAYRLMFPNFHEKYLPPKLSSVFSNGFPRRRWRRWTRRLYLFLSQFLDSSEDDTSDSENAPFPSVQRSTCDMDESVIGNLVQKAADRVFSRPARPIPFHASENTPFPRVQIRTGDMDESFIDNNVQKANRLCSRPARPTPPRRTPTSVATPALSAAPVMSLSKTAFQQQTAAVDTREKDIFVGVDAVSDNASISSTSASIQSLGSNERLVHRRPVRRRKQKRPTKTKSSRSKTRELSAIALKPRRGKGGHDGRRKGIAAARSVDLDRVRSEARSTADPSSASSSRALRKPTLKSMFSPYLEGSVPKDPKFLLFKGNGEVVDVRKLPITRSGRLSVPVLDVGHRQNIVRSSSGLVVKHGEPEKFFSSFVDD